MHLCAGLVAIALGFTASTLQPGTGSAPARTQAPPATQTQIDKPPRTVAAVDLKKYVGTYYEIARFPNGFQTKCAGDVTATYTIRDDGRIDVVNRCRTAGGGSEEARGVAKRADGDTSNARLKVRFAPAILSFIPRVWGDYWILATGPDYGYAVVGDPTRQDLWILSRTPEMPAVGYQQAMEVARSNGFDITKLVRTTQGR